VLLLSNGANGKTQHEKGKSAILYIRKVPIKSRAVKGNQWIVIDKVKPDKIASYPRHLFSPSFHFSGILSITRKSIESTQKSAENIYDIIISRFMLFVNAR
jgi:hypothetical protein